MAFLTGAPVRAAQHYPGLSWLRNCLFTHLATLPPSGGGPKEGAASPSLGILKAFGIEAGTVVPELRLSDEVRLRTAKLLVEEGIPPAAKRTAGDPATTHCPAGSSSGWITVNPFSRWSYKEWSPEKWVRIIDWLRREFGIAAVLVGSPAERGRAGELARCCLGTVYNLAGRTTLAELAGVLERSRLHVGVDSAAPHIAAAVGTPTVTLYGPSDWRYWAPPGGRHRVAVSDMDCIPCDKKGCEGGGVSRCLNNLEISQVQAVLREALSR
jgi:ADP-heptose:LPS heptosyltransferase